MSMPALYERSRERQYISVLSDFTWACQPCTNGRASDNISLCCLTDFNSFQDAKKSKLEGKGDKHETENTTPSKKTPSNDCSSDSLSLSPEQKSLIETKRLEAQMKLLNKKSSGLLTNVGLSWFKALQDEFSKDYFIKVCEFGPGLTPANI